MRWCLWLLRASFFIPTAQAISAFEPLPNLPHAGPATNIPDHDILTRAEDSGEGGPAINNLKIALKRRPSPANSRLKHRDTVKAGRIANRSNQLAADLIQGEPAATKPIDKRDYSFSIASSAPPKQSDSVPIHQDGADFSYFAPVAFGTGGKVMYLLVDTGATNAWVMGSSCKSKSCGVHNTFGKEDSTTLKPTGANFTVGYGSGVVSGELVNDTVAIGGLSTFTTFGLATEVSDDFLNFPIDGILALSRPDSNNSGFTTIMGTVIQSKVLEANLIGINLQRASDGTADGELNFGSPDATKYFGDLSYVNTLTGSKAWAIPIDDIVVNGVASNFTGKTAFIDTGTTFMLFPTQDAQRIHSLIPRSRQVDEDFQLPCSSDVLVQIKIAGTTYSVKAEDYVGKPIAGGDLCSSNIAGGLDTSANVEWIIGDVFLKNVYTVLDFDKNRIGFGVKAPPASSKQLSATASIDFSTSRAESTAEASSTTSSLVRESPRPTSVPEISGEASSAPSLVPNSTGSSIWIPHTHTLYVVISLCLLLPFLS